MIATLLHGVQFTRRRATLHKRSCRKAPPNPYPTGEEENNGTVLALHQAWLGKAGSEAGRTTAAGRGGGVLAPFYAVGIVKWMNGIRVCPLLGGCLCVTSRQDSPD